MRTASASTSDRECSAAPAARRGVPGPLRTIAPESGIVTAPPRKTKIVAIERRRGVRRDQGSFGEKSAGTAHGIEQHAASFADARPTRPEQHGGGDVFLERRAAAFDTVAAPMQTLAGEIHR